MSVIFEKVKDKVKMSSGGDHFEYTPSANTRLFADNNTGKIRIVDLTDRRKVTNISISEITGAPAGDAESVADWLIENFFFDSNISTYVGNPSDGLPFDNYTELITTYPAGIAGRFAFVENSQGTSWLPGSLGGTFYGAGWYYDTGASWSNKNDEIFNFIEDDKLDNRIIIRQSNISSTLGVAIDPTKEYFIDGVVDLSGLSINIEVPVGGIEIKGYSFNTSKLLCSDNNYTMFLSPVGGSGDFLCTDVSLETSGTSSQLFDLVANTGLEAIEINRVNFDNCTSMGSLDSYRQGFESGTGRFGGTPTLELIGNWVGGYRLSTSIARNINNATILKAGAGLMLNGRVLSDINMEGETNAIFSDMSESNILNDAELELINANFNGVLNPLTNIEGSSVKARFKNCIGLRNTYVGSRWTLTSETSTNIPGANTPVKMAGTTTYNDEQWFNSTSDNAFTYISSQNIEFEIKGVLSFAGGNNDQMNIIVRQWDDSAGSYIDLSESGTTTLNGGAGDRAEGVSILAFGDIEENDRVELWIENQTDDQDITAKPGGLVSIEERPS